jgi:hypothetical protein
MECSDRVEQRGLPERGQRVDRHQQRQVASGNAMVTASGRVADAGAISVTLISGMKRAVGSGHLTATSGSGTRRGALCSGTWTAHRI